MPPSLLRETPDGLQRLCTICNQTKPLTEFYNHKDGSRKHARTRCKECNKARGRRAYAADPRRRVAAQRAYVQRRQEEARTDRTLWAKYLLRCVRSRAKTLGIPFEITHLDVPIPELCPALGIPLERSFESQSRNSASVDRIDHTKGYVKGNVIIVSLKANTIKSDATADEIIAVGQFYKRMREGAP